jgi:hypothetical protein
VWNAYNRVLVASFVGDTTSSWLYNSSTWRQIRGSAGNQLAIVVGLSEDAMNVTYAADFSATSGAFGGAGIGINSTSTPSGSVSSGSPPGAPIPFSASYVGVPAIGATTVAPLEATSGGTGGTFYGSGGSGGTFAAQQTMTLNFRM